MTRWHPVTDADRDAVRAQLERMFAHPLFRNSKRYPALLSYVVDETLHGRADALKERTIGVEVFEREPDYETGGDHIVRTTAGEIRKRLAQYYLDTAHESEMRIDLPSGSYVPWFFVPTAEAEPPEPAQAPEPRRAWAGWPWLAAACALLALAGWLLPRPAHPAPSALDRFWQPVVASRGTVLLCVGDPAQSSSSAAPADPNKMTLWELHTLESMKVPFSDAVTLARLTGYLGSRNARYRIVKERAAQLPDLHEGPAVLIGAADNNWTLRLARQQRYYFELGPRNGMLAIRDTQQPARRDWSVDFRMPNAEFAEDYGLISRAFDSTTEQMVLVAAGLTRYGTLAAGEFLTSEAAMARLEALAPHDWEHKNLQIVFATKIVQGAPAPPRIVTTYFW